MKRTNSVELTWHAVPATRRELADLRLMALRLFIAAGLLSLLSVWVCRQLQWLHAAEFPTGVLVVVVLMSFSMPTLLLIQSRFEGRRGMASRYQVRETTLVRGNDIVLYWAHYKAFRVVEANQRRIEFIAKNHNTRTIPMPADVAEATVLDAIGKHLEPYSLGKHGVVEKQHPLPPLAAWSLAGTTLLVLLCFWSFQSEIRALLGDLPKQDRAPVLLMLGFGVGPLAFLLWYPTAHSQLAGVRRGQVFNALAASTLCGYVLAMPLLLIEPIGDTFKTLATLPDGERHALMRTVKSPRDLEVDEGRDR